jgi:hypothetical protein
MNVAGSNLREALQEWVHEWGTKCAVETNAIWLGVHHGDVESFRVLSRESTACSIDEGARDLKGNLAVTYEEGKRL